MKNNKIILLIAIYLTSCGKSYDSHYQWNIVVPTGAPAVCFYKYGNSGNFETNSEASSIIPYLVKGDVQAAVLPTNVAIQAITGKNVPYLLAATITFGNLFIASTGNDVDNTMNEGDYIVLFSEGSVPDKVFHYIYGDSLNSSIHYVKDAQVAAGCLKSGINVSDENNEVDYVLLAEPALTGVLNSTHGRSAYANLQDLYQTKSDGLAMFQASILINKDISKNEANGFLDSLKNDIDSGIKEPLLIKNALNEYADAKVKFGIPSAEMVYNVTLNGNKMGLGFKRAFENKNGIDNFLSLFGIGSTNEEIYFK